MILLPGLIVGILVSIIIVKPNSPQSRMEKQPTSIFLICCGLGAYYYGFDIRYTNPIELFLQTGVYFLIIAFFTLAATILLLQKQKKYPLAEGDGGESIQTMQQNPFYVFSLRNFLFGAIVLSLLLYFKMPPPNNFKHNVSLRYKALKTAEKLFNTHSCKAAVLHLKPLAEYKHQFPEVLDAQNAIRNYEAREKKRQKAWELYLENLKKKNWLGADYYLVEILRMHTPKERKNDIRDLIVERKRIKPEVKLVLNQKFLWDGMIEFHKERIKTYYRKRMQNPLNLLKAESHILDISKTTIPKMIDFPETQQALKDSKKFAREMKVVIAKCRYEISIETQLIKRCREFQEDFKQVAAEDLTSLVKSKELRELANKYVYTVHKGFREQFYQKIKEYKPLKMEEPIAVLYRLELLSQELQKFMTLFETSSKELDSLRVLVTHPFYFQLKALHQKVQTDFQQLHQKYSANLNEMKELLMQQESKRNK